MSMDAEQAMAKALEGQFWGWGYNKEHGPLRDLNKKVEAKKQAVEAKAEVLRLDWVMKETKLTCNVIIKVVSIISGVTVQEIKSPRRTKHIAYARMVAMHLCRKMTSLSLPAIGRVVGGRDHSTVLHACRKVEAEFATYKRLVEAVEAVISVDDDGGFVLNIPTETNRAEGVLEAPATALTAPTFAGGQHG